MPREQCSHPVKKFWFAFGHVSYENLQDPFMRQDTPLKISVLYFHNCPCILLVLCTRNADSA